MYGKVEALEQEVALLTSQVALLTSHKVHVCVVNARVKIQMGNMDMHLLRTQDSVAATPNCVCAHFGRRR